jgi:hypothetical protein
VPSGNWGEGVASRFGSSPGAARVATARYWGDRKTIVKDRKKELSRGLLADMLRQLGLDPRDLN